MTSYGLRSQIAIPVALSAAATAVVVSALTAPSALAARSAVTVKSSVSGRCAGWSVKPPSQCEQTSQNNHQVKRSLVAPAWANDAGCSGYYTADSNDEMYCKATAITVNNFKVAIRKGFWDGSNGFGWSKALYYHNLWMQPMIDTITFALEPRGSNSSRNYEVYHYNPDGYLDQEVVVVADIQDDFFQGYPTHDGKAVGVITGYCNNGSGSMETECPDWVDTGPNSI